MHEQVSTRNKSTPIHNRGLLRPNRLQHYKIYLLESVFRALLGHGAMNLGSWADACLPIYISEDHMTWVPSAELHLGSIVLNTAMLDAPFSRAFSGVCSAYVQHWNATSVHTADLMSGFNADSTIVPIATDAWDQARGLRYLHDSPICEAEEEVLLESYALSLGNTWIEAISKR